jgi:hypothetical protein
MDLESWTNHQEAPRTATRRTGLPPSLPLYCRISPALLAPLPIPQSPSPEFLEPPHRGIRPPQCCEARTDGRHFRCDQWINLRHTRSSVE